MPKLKTNRGAHKRFKVTKNKKYKMTKQNRRHLLESKSSKKSREMRRSTYVDSANVGAMKQLLPYA